MVWSENESFKHRMAKDLLFDWLLEADKGAEMIYPFWWSRPGYGVRKELRFYESSDMYYFENSGGVIWDGYRPVGFDPAADRGKILFVPDIVIFDKGAVRTLIEVVHTSPVSEVKLQAIDRFAGGYQVEVYEVWADTILEKVRRPKGLLCRRLR